MEISLKDEILTGESPTIEFKRDIPDQALKYLKTVSAFANCSGGRIVFGVDSDLSICGMDEPFAARDKIADSIANGIEPMVVPDIIFQTVDGKTLIVVEIAQGPRCPYWVKSLGRESGCSRCRNKAIAEAFAYMHVAEKWGLGIPNAMHEFEERGLMKPEYTDWGNAVKVTVRRIRRKLDTEPEKPNLGGGIDTVNVTVNDTVNVTVNCGASALLELIRTNPGNRVDYYARRLGKTKRTVMRYLSTMSEQIEFRGAPKTGGYYCK